MAKIIVENKEITIVSVNDFDFISLTDMANAKENESRAADVIKIGCAIVLCKDVEVVHVHALTVAYKLLEVSIKVMGAFSQIGNGLVLKPGKTAFTLIVSKPVLDVTQPKPSLNKIFGT